MGLVAPGCHVVLVRILVRSNACLLAARFTLQERCSARRRLRESCIGRTFAVGPWGEALYVAPRMDVFRRTYDENIEISD